MISPSAEWIPTRWSASSGGALRNRRDVLPADVDRLEFHAEVAGGIGEFCGELVGVAAHHLRPLFGGDPLHAVGVDRLEVCDVASTAACASSHFPGTGAAASSWAGVIPGWRPGGDWGRPRVFGDADWSRVANAMGRLRPWRGGQRRSP